VGDIIKVSKNEFFPADGLVLATSEPSGVCYIETKNLDGETNLKQKNVHKDIYSYYVPREKIDRILVEKVVVLEYERPNPYLYKFNGKASLQTSQTISIDANNFVLRGCSLRNTKWCYMMISYTGRQFNFQ
jgi:phospholipid-transporting ATPase